jgi:uncharacterized RDD family membrane protein YckC
MEQVLDEALFQTKEKTVKYAGFWPRLGALIIDGIILAPISYGLTYLNVTLWKGSLIMVLATLIGMAYKPVMEHLYGATLGKMSLNLKVTNLDFEKSSLSQILLRNIFNIAPSLVTLVLMIGVYQDPGFQSVSGYSEYSTFLSSFKMIQYVNLLMGGLVIADAIVMLADKRNRAWHDRIAGTFVIEVQKLYTK